MQNILKNYVFLMTRLDLVKEPTQWVLIEKVSIKQCETVSIKPCINREIESRSSQFSYTVIVETWT